MSAFKKVGPKLTYDQVKNFIEIESDSGCILLSEEYINAKSKLEIKCKCGEIFYATLDSFKSSKYHICINCTRIIIAKKRMRTLDEFKNEVFIRVGNEYEVLSDYNGVKEPIVFKHSICGNTYSKIPDAFLKGKRCPFCSGRMKKDTKTFKLEVYNLVGNEYTVLSEYKNNRESIQMKHNKCGTEYYVSPHNFLRNRRCPVCNESRGEMIIRHYLTKHDISFKKEYVFEELKNVEALRFDFALFNESNNLLALIEYDGEYHFKPIMGNKHLLYQQNLDSMKNIFCSNNNITLLRIPFWKFNQIKNLLDDFIQKLN